jgi:hypothetical protein
MSKERNDNRIGVLEGLSKLLGTKMYLMEEMLKLLETGKGSGGIPQKYDLLAGEVQKIDNQIEQLQGTLTIQTLEALESSSRKIEILTSVLAILTVILAILTAFPILKELGLLRL